MNDSQSTNEPARDEETPLPMPGDAGGGAAGGQEGAAPAGGGAGGGAAGDPPLPPPPSFGRQMGQLVIIPAAITVICILLALAFGLLAGRPDTLESQLLRLKQSSGAGRMAMGLQDPRYKDRGLAAANIAQMLPPAEKTEARRELADELTSILDENVHPDEKELVAYLLIAIGRLGQEGGLRTLLAWADSEHELIRQHVVRGILSWPDEAEAAEAAVEPLTRMVRDSSPAVGAEAAAALGALASGKDRAVLETLRWALEHGEAGRRIVAWNAAIALARLGDEEGNARVANLLLDRQALSELSAQTGGGPGTLDRVRVDHILISSIAAAEEMTSERIWSRIRTLAHEDQSLKVQNAAREVLLRKGRNSSENGAATRESNAAPNP